MNNSLHLRNLSALTDFYELTMANGYLLSGKTNTTAWFDMFFRTVPEDGGYAIMAGVEQLLEYLSSISFTSEDIELLEKKGLSEQFLSYLSTFKFECDVWAVPEGTPVFPGEPIVTVKGPIIQAQIIETMLLLTINHQSLIATKANRIMRAAGGRSVLELGSRRAQGYDGAVYGARAAYIGGIDASSCFMSERDFSVPAAGTMAHSWVQLFQNELEAFRTFARLYPNDCTLLVDTYNVLNSGVPNAIKVFDEELAAHGFRPKAIRIDSGNITFLSKKARKMLDDAGYSDCKIIASGSLDEYSISEMLSNGAKVDVFGVGERLITSSASPVFGGVYKLVAAEENGRVIPKIKLSENIAKISTPYPKKVYRLFDKTTKKIIADVITLFDEQLEENKVYKVFDSTCTNKCKTISNFSAKPLLVKIMQCGKTVYTSPQIGDIQDYCKRETRKLPNGIKQLESPCKYNVYLSEKLMEQKNKLIKRLTENENENT